MIDYEEVAIQARKNVSIKFGNKSFHISNRWRNKDYYTLKGYCADVAKEVKEILTRNDVSSKIAAAVPPGLGNHIIVIIEDENIIIDATINQYAKELNLSDPYKYVYIKDEYPMKLKEE